MLGVPHHGLQTDFEQRCGPYAGMVYRHCLHMLRNEQEAQDAAQESMLRAYRAYPSFRGKGVAKWLYAIAHNTCLDVLKSARYRREQLTLDGEKAGPEAADASLTPEEAYISRAENQRLWDMVSQLPQDQQTMIALYYGEGMTYDEIARAVGVRVGTVKSRLSRAKENLAGKWRDSCEKTEP